MLSLKQKYLAPTWYVESSGTVSFAGKDIFLFFHVSAVFSREKKWSGVFLNFHLFFFWENNSSFSSPTLWQTEPSDALRIYFFSCLLQFFIRKYSEKQRLSINKFDLFVLRAIGKKLYWKTGVNTSRQMSVKNTIFLGLFKERIF